MTQPFTTCAACRRDAPSPVLEPTLSVLDFRLHDLCPACIDHHAEPLNTLVRAVNTAGWKELPEEIRRAIRVFDMEEYVTVREWAERLSKRQLVVREDPKPDPVDDDDVRQMRAILDKIKQPPGPPKRGNWLIAAITLFTPWRFA